MLIAEKKKARPRGNRVQAGILQKIIQKEIRATSEALKRAKIDRLIVKFKNLKQIAGIKRDKNHKISEMANGKDEIRTDPQGIADALADFFEKLYADPGRVHVAQESPSELLPVTVSELRGILKKLKNVKSANSHHIVAEFMKWAGDDFLQVIANVMSEILSHSCAAPPKYWRTSITKVFHKSGDSKIASNYRPISIISIMYKTYARMILSRVGPELNKRQAKNHNQAAFRRGYSVQDHLLAITLLAEMTGEQQMPLFVVALGFAKAFDSISHSAAKTKS